jgi:hypothetical protein
LVLKALIGRKLEHRQVIPAPLSILPFLRITAVPAGTGMEKKKKKRKLSIHWNALACRVESMMASKSTCTLPLTTGSIHTALTKLGVLASEAGWTVEHAGLLALLHMFLARVLL